ncbi:GNAT family N-acetyltransferase [Oceanobacillus alkalisoli]|uniref:GNAT family N-acetyltransferase n=1 Tax=Oceanobacillus alkalisoli TaxID=2925113 RepID=UPI001F120414|nr:GNAT family N-acetyltransferase [Oceanobacillus alkalisoli]MCF3943656.1 N-acetyltransferase [Oceanobacillus alkalisoli]
MTTTIKKAGNKFYVGEDVKSPLAEITYVESSRSLVVIDHTYVSDELRGQGIAGKLLEQVVLYAREHQKKIKPLCVFAKKRMEETVEYHDVLAR